MRILKKKVEAQDAFNQSVHKHLKAIQAPPFGENPLETRAFLMALVEHLTEAAAGHGAECDIEEPYRRPMRAVVWALLDNAPNAEEYAPEEEEEMSEV